MYEQIYVCVFVFVWVCMCREVVAQWYLRNCALCVLSRYAVTEDISTDPSLSSSNSYATSNTTSNTGSASVVARCDVNVEFIDAVHLAGAACHNFTHSFTHYLTHSHVCFVTRKLQYQTLVCGSLASFFSNLKIIIDSCITHRSSHILAIKQQQ